MARNQGFLQVVLEHRFFGKSQPESDWSTEHLNLWTGEQVIADAALFIRALQAELDAKYGFSPTRTYAIAGGSFGGNLVAWFNLKFPHLIQAAIADTAPVMAIEEFWIMDDFVGRILAQHPPCLEMTQYAI